MALELADYVVTEAGFGSDLGAEKFLDIKCRKSGLAAVGGGARRDGARAEVCTAAPKIEDVNNEDSRR